MTVYHYEYHGPDSATGRAIWSCTREGAGIAGYGPTPKEALGAFLDVEQEVTPERSYLTGFNQFEPPERVVERPYTDEE
jgi:hypothetical protein